MTKKINGDGEVYLADGWQNSSLKSRDTTKLHCPDCGKMFRMDHKTWQTEPTSFSSALHLHKPSGNAQHSTTEIMGYYCLECHMLIAALYVDPPNQYPFLFVPAP